MVTEVPSVERIKDALKDVASEFTDRDRLLADLVRVRELGFEKIDHRNTKNNEKISWSKVIITSIKVADQVLKSKERDEMLDRIKVIEDSLEEMRQVKLVEGH